MIWDRKNWEPRRYFLIILKKFSCSIEWLSGRLRRIFLFKNDSFVDYSLHNPIVPSMWKRRFEDSARTRRLPNRKSRCTSALSWRQDRDRWRIWVLLDIHAERFLECRTSKLAQKTREGYRWYQWPGNIQNKKLIRQR